MKVKSIKLKNFKRFTDLEVSEISEDVKLVLITGPNGSGKSSLFDAFIHWHRIKSGWGYENDTLFYQKIFSELFDLSNSVQIEIHGGHKPNKGSLYVRTAYRNDPDFTISGLNRLNSPIEELRLTKSIQNDQTVSQNYQRLVYDTISGVYSQDNNSKTVETLRNELIGNLRDSMTAVFGDLQLNDIADPLGNGTFFFKKGVSDSYHYKNLSGGEKAAFDLLLDIHTKRKFYSDAIWCIDEMETHLHTRVQGALMREIYSLVPEGSQLWLTTHSLGVMRAAQAVSVEAPGTIAIIDFDGLDADVPSRIVPSNIDRIAWEKMLSIAVDDLSTRIMPSTIVVCEGSKLGTRRKSFDAEIYNRILGSVAPGVVFVSGGSSNQVAASGASVRSTLDDIASKSRVVSLCDRDDKSDAEVEDFEKNDGIVIGVRNLESYLFGDDVLKRLASKYGRSDLKSEVLNIKHQALAASVLRGNKPDDLKSAAGQIFVDCVRVLGITRAGNDKDAFMRDTLAPLITPKMPTHDAMKRDILDRLKGCHFK